MTAQAFEKGRGRLNQEPFLAWQCLLRHQPAGANELKQTGPRSTRANPLLQEKEHLAPKRYAKTTKLAIRRRQNHKLQGQALPVGECPRKAFT